MDDDLLKMTEDELRAEVRKLRAAIRHHRDSNSHDLCWYVPELWDTLPEKQRPKPHVPDWCDFIQNCAAYRNSLDNTP